MSGDYGYKVSQCDVPSERHGALMSYRDKRHLWLTWIDGDEHHAIWTTLSSMVWTDVVFKSLTHFALADDDNALNNPLMMEALLSGHVATQVLAIRRLIDNGGSDIISLRRLLKDLHSNFNLLTRENYVCFDGLPYNYEAGRHATFLEHASEWGKGGVWLPTEGPKGYGTSERAHRQFDKLSGIDPANRHRNDRLPIDLLMTIEKWLNDSGADELAKWSHAYLAHAGGPAARKRIASLYVTADKISNTIRALACVTEAVSAWLLSAGGRSNALMPVAQFNPFDKLDKPIMQPDDETGAHDLWQRLGDECNAYLEPVEAALIGRRPIVP